MDLSELWHRILEKVGKITEPFALSEISNVRLTQKVENFPPLPPREAAPVLLKQTLANDAAKLLDGKWTLFGWKEVQVSSPPDWHRDYMCNVSVARSARLNHRSLSDGADVRVIWEINRWAEMVRVAMHGRLNDDVSAVQHAQSWLSDWVKENPVGEGINWTSALEGGLRLINFCWFDALISEMGDGRSEIQQKQEELRDAIVPTHVWWVHRHLSFGSSANNHRLGELTGLLLAVKRWPEMERIAGTAENLWKQIADCIMTQFAEDGGNREQALHYHLFAYEMALHACNAMKVTDGLVIERLQCATEFFVRMSHPQEPWDYGDSDDAQIVPLTMHREKAVAEWCAWMRQAGILPGQPHRNDAMALSYWLGHGQNAHGTGNRQDAHSTGWWIARESGMAVIERDGWKVRVDASPLGFGKMAAHGHCDALHVSIWDGEHALVIDPGTGGYFGSNELRTQLVSWNAHNGPQPIEGFKTPKRRGAFLWAYPHSIPEIDEVGDSIHAHFSSEEHHFARTVRFMDGANHVAVWDLESNKKTFKVRWLIAPDCSVRTVDSRIATFEISRGSKLWSMSVMPADDGNIITLTTGSASRYFGDVESCPAIEVVAQGWLRTEWHRV